MNKNLELERSFQTVAGVPFFRLGDGQVLDTLHTYPMYVVVKGSRASTMRSSKEQQPSLVNQPGIQVDGIDIEAGDPLSPKLYLYLSLRTGLGTFQGLMLVQINDEADRELFRATLRQDIKPVFEAMCHELGIELTYQGGATDEHTKD